MTVDLSLITTTYNRPDYLLDCAYSVERQVYPSTNWIIYIDDELDKYKPTLKIINNLRIPNITILGGTHIGRVEALYESHKLVASEYVGWLDDDDLLHSNCISSLIGINKEIIYTDFFTVKNNIIRLGQLNRVKYSYSELLKRNIVFHFRVFKQELYLKIGGVDLSFDTTMDYELNLRLLKYTIPYKINIPLYFYRLHNNRISCIKRRRQRYNYERAIALTASKSF